MRRWIKQIMVWLAWDFFQQKERVRFSTESVRRHVCSA